MPSMRKKYAAKLKPFVRPRPTPKPVKPVYEPGVPSENFPEVPLYGGGSQQTKGQRRNPPLHKY